MFSNQYITYMYIIIFNVKLSLHVTAHKFSNQANLMLNVYMQRVPFYLQDPKALVVFYTTLRVLEKG